MILPSAAAFLKDAVKAVPQIRWAMGIAGIVAIIAIVEGWKVDPMMATFGTIVMLVLMVVLVVFARLAGASTIEFRWPVQVFMWAALCLVISAATLLFTSAFFSWPITLRKRDSKHYPALEKGYKPGKSDFEVWDLEDDVNTLRGQWETVSYFGHGTVSQEVLEQATKLQQALLNIDDRNLGPSGHVIKREYACYASIMAATTDPNINRRISFSSQAIDLCRQALNDHAFVQANKNKNSNLAYVANWATRVDERPFATYLLAIAYCVNGVSADNETNKENAVKTLGDVPDYYLARYPPSQDWVLKQCSTDNSQKEAHK